MTYDRWIIGGLLACAVILGTPSLIRNDLIPDYKAMRAVMVEVSDADGHGSGVLTSGGFVLTAKHVINASGNETITLPNGKTVHGHMIWETADPADVAMIQLDTAVPGPYAKMSCRLPHIGETLYAVGLPMGWGAALSSGMVAGTVVPDKAPNIMVTMALVPGMSGGPIFDRDGKVVALAEAILLEPLGFLPVPSGMGIVTPINSICPSQLKASQ